MDLDRPAEVQMRALSHMSLVCTEMCLRVKMKTAKGE